MSAITVLISAGKHPVNGVPRATANDSIALSLGLELQKVQTNSLKVLYAGDAKNPALQDYLALGATQIDVVETKDNVVENLAKQLNDADLILTGSQAESGVNTGLLPYLLAEKLNISVINNVLAIQFCENSIFDEIEVLQYLPKGKRRIVKLPLPAVVIVHPLAIAPKRFAFAKRLAGRVNALSPIATDSKTADNAYLIWQTLPIKRKHIKLKARNDKTGHERLLEAISAEGKNGVVVNEGNSVEKAQVILNYLREHQAIDF
jgi:electron transfer flavoprotein beta subunit